MDKFNEDDWIVDEDVTTPLSSNRPIESMQHDNWLLSNKGNLSQNDLQTFREEVNDYPRQEVREEIVISFSTSLMKQYKLGKEPNERTDDSSTPTKWALKIYKNSHTSFLKDEKFSSKRKNWLRQLSSHFIMEEILK